MSDSAELYELFINSAGFFALANTDDPYHSGALAAMRRAGLSRAKIATSNLVLAESHALFLTRKGRHAAFVFLQGVLSGSVAIERVSLQDEDETFRWLTRYSDKDFSDTDASSLR